MDKFRKYETDAGQPDKNRPLGISGILRCNNNADFIGACIDSCIDALDELVIVYHDCVDGTDNIICEKQKQYPDKIRIYYYEPYIYPINLNEESYSEVMALSATSIHLLSGYTNYAISKTTYRYAVKIDSDQIYFTDKLTRLCNAYRSVKKVNISLMECIAYNLYRSYQFSYQRQEMKSHLWIENIATCMYPYYFSYVEKRIINDKTSVSLSGINVYTDGQEWMIGLGDKVHDILPPFNGVKDTFFFEISKETMYDRLPEHKKNSRHRVLEILRYNKEMLDIGFIWFHLRAITHANKQFYRDLYTTSPDRYIPLKVLRRNGFRSLAKKYHPYIAVAFAESIFSYFHTATRHRIPWNVLDNILEIYNKYDEEKLKIQNHMDKRDYYLEFHDQLDRYLTDFTGKKEKEMPSCFQLGNYSVKIPLQTYLFYQLMNQRERYDECRKKGMSITESMAKINSYLEHFTWDNETEKQYVFEDSRMHPWYRTLSSYQGWLLIYIFNQRQLNYLIPLIRHLQCPTVLLSEYEPDDNIDLPDCVLALTISASPKQCISNTLIKRNFPLLFEYANTFETLIRILSPQCIICLEGCHYQEQLLAIIAQNYNIPSIGIQQGWPSFMRTGFKHLPFEYYFTWGEKFNLCWQKENTAPGFVGMGYMYEVEDHPERYKRDCISFFLQGPLFLSDESYLNEIIYLIKEQARTFPDQIYLIREHPEFKLRDTILGGLSQLSNIKIVSSTPLKEVYSRSRVVVSHFSSSIMECLVHGSVPLVYDPTTNSRYFPDIEKEKLGMIAKTPDEFKKSLTYILDNYTVFQDHIHKERHLWFSNTGHDTLDAMKKQIIALCPALFHESPINQ